VRTLVPGAAGKGEIPVSQGSLEILVNRIKQLPALPAVVHHLTEVTEDPDATISAVEEVIRADQSLTAKVLKLVNSAFFALRSRVSTVHHAAVILGLDALRNMALTVHTYECLAACGRNDTFDKQAFWEHAAAVGIFAKKLATAAKYKKPDEAFVAGLLHDLGKVVLDEYFAPEFAQALAACRDEAIPLAVCEERVLGFDHGVAGAEVGRKWRFPAQLVEVIERHHAPPGANVLSAVVQLADTMAKAWRIGASGDPLLQPINSTVWKLIPLNEQALRDIVEASRDEIAQVQELFGAEDDQQQPQPPQATTRRASEARGSGERVAFVTTDKAPLLPLMVYLEESDVAVRLVRPEQPFPADEIEYLVVQMPDQPSALRVKSDLVTNHPALRSVPAFCVAPPCLPSAVVADLRRAVPASAPTR